VARLDLSAGAEADLNRLHEFLAADDPVAADAVVDLILEGIAILERHPLIGRPVEERLRELVISRGRSGYVALYQYFEAEDVVMIVALRHQREAGYQEQQ
jgi:plasmid stabilization system protein ParE